MTGSVEGFPTGLAGPGSEADRLARVTLSTAGEPGHPRLTRLAQQIDPVELVRALLAQGPVRVEGEAQERQLGEDLAGRLAEADPARELQRAADAGVRFVTPHDDEWPRQVDDLAHAPAMHERGGVPVGLWCRGPLRLDEATARSVAVVGSRSSTTYGTAVADGIAATLARAGWGTVSGAAFGIDQAAHRGCVVAGGQTVAVLACGADRAYPLAHRRLIDHVAEVGLVVSEAPLGAAPTRIRFLARNRVIAALTAGTVVVEAAARSGALNTAGWAAGVGRVVMGVPGPVTSAASVGVHQLVRTRDALLVTRGEEVLEAVSPSGSGLLLDPRGPEQPRDRLSSLQRQVLDAVPLVQGASRDAVARTAGVSRTRTTEALRVLHDQGLVEHALGRWRLLDDTLLPGAAR